MPCIARRISYQLDTFLIALAVTKATRGENTESNLGIEESKSAADRLLVEVLVGFTEQEECVALACMRYGFATEEASVV